MFPFRDTEPHIPFLVHVGVLELLLNDNTEAVSDLSSGKGTATLFILVLKYTLTLGFVVLLLLVSWLLVLK